LIPSNKQGVGSLKHEVVASLAACCPLPTAYRLLLTVIGVAAGALVMAATLPAQTRPPAPQSSEAETRDKIVRYLRERFPMSPSAKVTVSPLRPSAYPGFYQTTVTVEDGKEKGSQEFYVSKDYHYLIQGNIYTLGADPRREAERLISTEGRPTVGPANAPVTIVEYADLQCPTCAKMHEFLENQLLPKYGDKVRVVFKEYPLVQIHDWALTASLACECVYAIKPDASVAYRTKVFEKQTTITAVSAQAQLLRLAEQAGVDLAEVRSCIDSKQTMSQIESDFKEAQTLGVSSTPTFFINGKMLVGGPAPEEFYKVIDEALKR
jgi:protein-disulfide isomerase